MKYVSVLLFLFATNILFCQEMVTTILSEGTNANYLAEEIDGINYLMEITSDDVLTVYEVKDDFTVSTVHSRKFSGLFESDFYITVDGLLYTFDDASPVIYDFVNDKLRFVNIPSAFYGRYWSHSSEYFAQLWAPDASGQENNFYIVGSDGTIQAEGDSYGYTQDIYKKYLIKTIEDHPNNTRSYALEYIPTGEEIIILNQVPRLVHAFINDQLFYVNEQGQLIKFDLMTQVESIVPNITYLPEDVISIKVIDDNIFIQNRVDFQDNFIYMYDVNSGTMLNTFAHENLVNFTLKYSFVAFNNLVISANPGVYIFDLDTAETIVYDARSYSARIPILDDRFIVTSKKDEISFIDLMTGQKFIGNEDLDISFSPNTNILPVGNSFLGVFHTVNNMDKSVFRIDVNDFTIEYASDIDNTNLGIDNFAARLLAIGDNIILNSSDIYKIENSEVVKINPYKIIKKRIESQNSKMTFICENESKDRIFYSFDGKTLTEEALIPYVNPFPLNPTVIYDYRITSDKIIFLESINSTNHELISFDKATGSKVKVKTYDSFIFFHTALFQTGDSVYYSDLQSLYLISNDELLNVLDYDNQVQGLTTPILHNDYFYHLNDIAISIIGGEFIHPFYVGNFESALPTTSEAKGSISFLVDFAGDNNSNKLLLVEGESAIELEFENKVRSIEHINYDHFLIETVDTQTDEIRAFLLNEASKQLYEITGMAGQNRVFEIVVISGRPHLLSKNTSLNKVYVTALDENYEDPILVYTTDSYRGIGGNFVSSGDFGVTYLGEEIGVIKDDFPVLPMKLRGVNSRSEMLVNHEGYVYFLANDVDFGNQVFRVNPEMFFLSNANEEIVSNVLDIFPNPANSLIKVDDAFENQNYRIVDSQGKFVREGIISQRSIDIRNLKTGVYFLQSSDGNYIFTGTIVKQ